MQKETIDLSGVNETMLVPLYAPVIITLISPLLRNRNSRIGRFEKR